MLILFLLKRLIDFLWNIKARYFEKDTLAYDEIVKDVRDYEMAGNIDDIFPSSFKYKPRQIFNQAKDWYRSSCTAQWTWGASDTIRKFKADKREISPFLLWDEVKKRKIGKEWQWAYLIDTIKTAKDMWKIDWYYRVLTHEAIKKALYNTDLIVTWSNKIDWKRLWETWYIVDKVSSWSWHAFYIVWWNEIWYIAMNSYWEQYWLKWTFIIPYDVFEKVAFNSTYAITVDPEWASYTPEELYRRYLVNKKHLKVWKLLLKKNID